MATLVRMGKRWLPKPPPGFSLPPEHTLANLHALAAHFAPSRENAEFEDALARSPENFLTLQLMQMGAVQSWLHDNGPTLYVPADMAEACANTDALSTVEGSDIRTVYPLAYVCLPDSCAFVSPVTGDTMQHLFWSFVDGDQFPVWLNGVRKPVLRAKGRRLFMVGFWNGSHDGSSYALALDQPGRPLNDVIDETRKVFVRDDTRHHELNPGLAEAEKAESEVLGEWMAGLCVNLALMMQSYPQYVQPLPKQHCERQSFRDRAAPVSVVIHRSPVRDIRQIVVERERRESAATDRRVAAHWRKGHWRRQPHGDDFELTNPDVQVIVLDDGRRAHMRWIEPIFVGAKDQQAVDRGAPDGRAD